LPALDDARVRTRHLLRELTPRVLGIVVRRYQDFSGCEDAVQEALLAASEQWPKEGVPESPAGWLIHVASRRVTDEMRANAARRFREKLVVSLVPADEQIALAADEVGKERDDTLDLFFMSCHPALSAASQVALTLRAVGGLTTAEIARAFMVPEPTMAQRLSRAKQTIKSSGKSSGVAFAEPTPADRAARLPAVMQVLYLIFSEGYAASAGDSLFRVDLSAEAMRVTRLLARTVPDEPEIDGLLALMLLTDARREARTGTHGELIPLDAQDRSRWNRAAIAEGVSLIDAAMLRGAMGPYQVQAAIAALHDEAASTEKTDWAQILALYGLLVRMSDGPMARLSHAIALAMVEGPAAGIAALDALAQVPELANSHRLDAARAHLFERLGDRPAAIRLYRAAAAKTGSAPERTYLLVNAARLAETDGG
jgi:RNA polymerase sigma factor (sigma-70 family)